MFANKTICVKYDQNTETFAVTRFDELGKRHFEVETDDIKMIQRCTGYFEREGYEVIAND